MSAPESDTSTLGRETAFLMAARGFAFLIAFPIPLILVRVLSTDQFGLIKQLTLLHGTLTSSLTLGLGASLYYFVPRNPEQAPTQIAQTTYALFGLGTLGALCLIVFRGPIATLLNNRELEPYIPYLALSTMLVVVTSTLETIMLVQKQTKLSAWISVQSELLRSALVAVAALFTRDVLSLLLAGIAWSICRLIALLAYFRLNGIPICGRFRWSFFRGQLAYSIPFALAVISATLSESLHQYVVSHAFTPALFAIYSIGYIQIPIVSVVFDSVSDVALVRLSELARDQRFAEGANVVAGSIRRVSLLLLPLYAWLTVNAHDFIIVLYTSRFEASVPLFRTFLILIVAETFTTNYVLRAFGDTPFILYSYIARIVAGAVALAILVPSFGLWGAALATVLTVAAHRLTIALRASQLLGVSVRTLVPWSWVVGLTSVLLGLATLTKLASESTGMGSVGRLFLSGVFFTMAYLPLALAAQGNDLAKTSVARRWLKRQLSTHTPRLYSRVAWVMSQIMVEYHAALRVGVRHLLPWRSRGAESWQRALPVQRPRRVSVPALDVKHYVDLLEHFKTTGLPYAEGGHTVYLPPPTLRRSVLASAFEDYPPTTGLKIMKNPGGVADTHYVNRDALSHVGESRIHYGATHGHPHLSLVANLLYSEGIGPRLFDLLELETGSTVWTAYALDHIDGRTPTVDEWQAGVETLRTLEGRGLIRVILPQGFDDEEFEAPDCRGNAISTRSGKFNYVDFQNFRLVRYERFLNQVVQHATQVSHFGDTSLLRGGRYLYQTVPGVTLAAKRDIQVRTTVLSQLMTSAGVSVAERMVLDIGCNIGVMMAEYLKLGAKWCHGWDRSHVTPHTERLLLALGCTRFSVTGVDLHTSHAVEADLPAHLHASLDNCVISYLAIRGHVGWLNSLGRIRWSFLIYEGHEGETDNDFSRFLEQLNALVPVKIAAIERYRDGDSDERTAAIIVNTPAV